MSSPLLRVSPRLLGLALSCSFALLPACSDDPAPTEEEEVEEPEENEPDEPTGRRDSGTRPTLDSGTPPARPDSGVKVDSGVKPVADAGGLDAAVPPTTKPDAATPPVTPPATCSDTAKPHSCYTPAAANPKGCPATSPEIPFALPPITEWDGCNGLMVGAGATCAYDGPGGQTASCLCDSGAHWICIYL